MKPSIARGIDDYLARDWRLARESKDAYWAARVRRLGPREGSRIADLAPSDLLPALEGFRRSTGES